MIIVLAGGKRKKKEQKENGMSCRNDTECKRGLCSVCPLNGLLNNKACGIAKDNPCTSHDDCCHHGCGGFCVKNVCQMAEHGVKMLCSMLDWWEIEVINWDGN